jgi:hypothetical protein
MVRSVAPELAAERPQDDWIAATWVTVVDRRMIRRSYESALGLQTLQRITEPIWWHRHSGGHSAEPLRLGKQTLCQLSYSRSVSRSAGPSA